MIRLFPTIVVLSLLATSVAYAVTDPAQKVLDRHVAAMTKGDLEALMADYADNAVVVSPPGMVSSRGVFVGKKSVRKLFGVLTDGDHIAGDRTMQSTTEAIADDTLLLRWSQYRGKPNQVTGRDVFVIRNGKIVFQNIAPDAKKP